MLETGCGVVALFMADHHDLAPADPPEPANDRKIVGKGAVAGERHEILDEAGDIILEVRPLRMAGDLRFLPRRELGIGIAQQLVGFGLELRDLSLDVHRARIRGFAQLGDPALQFLDGLFEFEEGDHGGRD
jgi:hypothetical protein